MNNVFKIIAMALFFVALSATGALANNLQITNVSVIARDATTGYVEFTISWENSWRYANGGDSLFFHDAVWVFFKVQAQGGLEWQHVMLEGSGLNPSGFSTGSGTPIEIVVPSDRVGMFVRRSGNGSGETSVQNVRMVWNYADSGMGAADAVRMQAMGIEMCYVAQGAFKVGDGTKDQGQLFKGGTAGAPQPFEITSEGAIVCSNAVGNYLWGASVLGYNSMGGAGEIPAEFPKGYKAFYCMKYELTMGQYADFCNLLTRAQQNARADVITLNYYKSHVGGGSPSIVYRNTIRLTEDPGDPYPRTYTTTTPDRACNFVSWDDQAAYSDWAGLRPMTELEFEKTCRGPLAPVAGEYVWGNTTSIQISGPNGVDGSGEEFYNTGNRHITSGGGPVDGPVRVGIFAKGSTSRVDAGASYWGIMELGGNNWERAITIGNLAGRAYTGLHGNGVLTSSAASDVQFWPPSDGTGAGLRGSGWANVLACARTSDRVLAVAPYPLVNGNICIRAVRTAPP